ncbi:MAG: SecY family transport protein, partial [Clostridia bacterium]|nr:SecY family transport protein [Clostridia bacterium]
IFATSIVLFPQLLMSFFWPTSDFYYWYASNLGSDSWIYNIVVALLIVFFSYFYAQMAFNPEEVSRNIQQNGGFIPGIRAGKPTTDYLKKISSRVTLFGAIFLAFVFVVPALIFKGIDSSNTLVSAFSATGILIVVSVALEFDKQLEAQMLMRNYRGFLK